MEKKVPHVLQYPADYGGCGFWRLLWPQVLLNMKGNITVQHSKFYIRDFLHYANVNAVHIQRQLVEHQLQFFRKLYDLKKRLPFRLIYDIDDIFFYEDIPEYNSAKEKVKNNQLPEILALCDELTVSTPYLRDYYKAKTGLTHISVIPNSLPYFWIGHFYDEGRILQNYRVHHKKPRILYAGSSSHYGDKGLDDFTHVQEAILSTMDRYQWVFVGAFPKSLASYIVQKKIEYHPWVCIADYPKYLSKLQINMWIAPLADNIFNRGKSDLKLLEASAYGLPIACQDLCTYNAAPIRFRTGEELLHRIQETLATEEGYLVASRNARLQIEGRWLERNENIGKYMEIYTLPYGDIRRTYV